jgi:integrase
MSKPNVHGLPQHLRKDDGGYFLDYFVQEAGVKTRKRVRLGEIPLPQAKRILAQHMQAIVENKYLVPEKPVITFSEAAESFLAYSRSRKRTFRRDEEIVKNLKSFFGSRPLGSLTLDLVEKYVLSRRERKRPAGRKEITGAALNRETSCLKTIVRRAVLNRQLDRNPIEGLKPFKEFSRSRTLTPEEYKKLFSCLKAHIKPMVELAYVTAMRRGEILKLRWDQVDFKNRVIVLEAADTKTLEKREVPLDAQLVETLHRVPRTLGSEFVFTLKGKPIADIKTSFRSACSRAGIKDFRFHDLRHCAVTNMRKAGIPDNVIMSISGHKTTSMFRRYDAVDRVDRRNAIEKLRLNDTYMTKTVLPELVDQVK